MGTTFYRPARSYPPVLPINDIVLSSPPTVDQGPKGAITWLQYLLPAVGGLGSMAFVFAFHANMLMIIAGSTIAVSSVGGGLAMGIGQRRNLKKQVAKRKKIYLGYLAQHRTRLKALAEQQRQASYRLYPNYRDLARLLKKQTYLWERRPSDKDFLTVRIGLGAGPLSCRLSMDLGHDLMVEYMPELQAQAEALLTEWSYLNDMPVLIPLRSVGVLAINGKREVTRALARALISQLVAFHAPEDLRCMAYFPEKDSTEWSWLKWLPHTRRLRQIKPEGKYEPEQLCMIAHSAEEVFQLLSTQIKPELERRHRLKEHTEDQEPQQHTEQENRLPHLLVLFDPFSPFDILGQAPEIDALLRDAAKFGMTIICLVDNLQQEPAQIQGRLSITSVGIAEYEEIRLGGQRAEGVIADKIDARLCEFIARSMAPLSLAEKGAQQDLSQDVPLLNLMNISHADALNVAETWKARDRQWLLNVPIGIRSDGKPLFIDFKEAAEKGMGPHGLVIGATGSGKSELLRTIVVSMAVMHDPQTVNFVLIDFKGGASFADFAALPHVAGIMTNLQSDLSLVDRVYYSLLGEQQRRQRLLHDAGNLDNIKQYQAKWQNHPEMEPMPHLLIIADEFAELITNRPEFLELFIIMGRVGRSLGLHLLFATQRLDEGRIRGLEGHLRYRICLRTFSAEESKTVLGRSDAYFLPSTPGVGYFKVDTDTYHLFKTAVISLPYIPAQEQVSLQSRIREFNSTGRLVKYQPHSATDITTSPTTLLEVEKPADLFTEMGAVIEHLSRATNPQYIVHQVWLPPLSKQLPLQAVLPTDQSPKIDGRTWSKMPPFGPLCVPIGLLDMPQQQSQKPFLLDFSGSGGHLALVGAPQTGKSTFLRTLITSLMLTHSPYDVQIYCIDLGGGLLRILEQAPHVGAICGKADRDKLRRLVRKVSKVIEDREYLFRENNIDSMAMFRARRQAGDFAEFPFGDVFLVIDNFALLVQEFDLEVEIAELIANGLTYGVYIVLVANRWAEIRAKLQDNIGTRLELSLNDPADSIFGKAVAARLPMGVPGRGINQEKLQFQTALPIVDTYPENALPPLQQALEQFVQRVRKHWHGPTAAPVHMLPALVPWTGVFASPTIENIATGVPIGLEEFRLSPISLDLIENGPHFLILGDAECGKTTLLRALIRGIEQRYSKEQAAFAIIDYRKTLVDFAESQHLLAYAHNTTTLTECIGNLKADFTKRAASDVGVPLARFRTAKRWTDRHYFLFVDDYDSLATSTSTPLSPLIDYMLTGRDIGFHLVLARRIGGIGRASFEPMLQRLREMGSQAIIMSGDPQEGRLIHNQAATLQPPGRGFFVQRSQPSTLVQVAFAEPAYLDLDA